jgi:hypothetical protein
MANTIRNQENTQSKQVEGKGIFSTISNTFRMDGMFDNGVPLHYMPKVIWITFLVILYIANAHYTEKTVRKIDRLKFEVEELRTEFTTLKASYMFDSKQSEIAKKVEKFGLVESKKPPEKITLDD